MKYRGSHCMTSHSSRPSLCVSLCESLDSHTGGLGLQPNTHAIPPNPTPSPHIPNPQPQTPNPTPHTPHPTPQAPHPRPHTPHPTPHTPHPTPQIFTLHHEPTPLPEDLAGCVLSSQGYLAHKKWPHPLKTPLGTVVL